MSGKVPLKKTAGVDIRRGREGLAIMPTGWMELHVGSLLPPLSLPPGGLFSFIDNAKFEPEFLRCFTRASPTSKVLGGRSPSPMAGLLERELSGDGRDTVIG
jgi:hypothetical protein